jgi:uncharacterized membrane protein
MNSKTHFTELSLHQDQKGAVLVLSVIFLMAMLSFLMLSVDGHFLLQSRLENQNISEYYAVAAFAGYQKAEVSDSSKEFEERRNSALSFLHSMQSTNYALGMKANESEWDFSNPQCTGITCKGAGWEMVFGQWVHEGNEGYFIPGAALDDENPESIDPTSVNAVQMELVFKKSSVIQFFHTSHEQDSGNVPITSIAYLPCEECQIIRLAKFSATGNAYKIYHSDTQGKDDTPEKDGKPDKDTQ